MPHDYLLGLDIGSSFVKASLLDAGTGIVAASASEPAREMAMAAPQPGWAEQDPRDWWRHAVAAIRRVLSQSGEQAASVRGVGLSYQMHGLVLVDAHGEPLRPAIIWCDSRAVAIGEAAFERIGRVTCLARVLNSPGNFTAAKLAWVKAHEPDVFAAADKAMLPGDYIALRLTGRAATTASGLSEGVLWDFLDRHPSPDVLEALDLPATLLPELVPTFGLQGEVDARGAAETGLAAGTPVTYRAGDQPNNAFSLRVLHPGEVAATAGTSGVVYAVIDQASWDGASRVNTFLHVTDRPGSPRYGVLLCVNGTGALYSWLKRLLGGDAVPYDEMNRLSAGVPIGADGVVVLPFGNGAERSLGNREPGASVHGVSLVRHGRAHLLRAAQEGIVFALHHGMGIMREMGLQATAVRAGRANMFLSPVFSQAFADVSGAVVELFDTDGAQGAARAAGLGAAVFASEEEAFAGLRPLERLEPDARRHDHYLDAYGRWFGTLQRQLSADS
ncbi:MAG: Carbohydrate kinase, FGGY-like protein [Acidobacteria bacterium]|nr:Carbohydrate kinase, FGGY-like protein [Acidobacteriota bacterium]